MLGLKPFSVGLILAVLSTVLSAPLTVAQTSGPAETDAKGTASRPDIGSESERNAPEFLPLTPDEKAWIAAHPRIRVGVDGDYAPYSFLDSARNFIGVAPDFLHRIGEVTGLTFELVPELTWPEIIDGSRKRTLDVIATAVRTPERTEFLDFTQIYLPTPLAVMVRSDEERVSTANDLNGLTVALVEGYSASSRVLSEHPGITPHFVTTPLEGLQAVAIGRADAYVGVLGINAYLAREHGLTNLRAAARIDLLSNGQRFAVRKDWPELATILDKALARMALREKNEIFSRWVPIVSEAPAPAKQAPSFDLTAAEATWLAEHRDISIGINNAWPPMDFVDSTGTPRGIGVEFVELLNTRLNGALRVVPAPWLTGFRQVQEQRLDALMDITPLPARDPYFNFTTPYVNVPHVIFAMRDAEYVSELDELAGQTVGVETGFFILNVLRTKYPDIQVREYGTTSDALGAVSKGEVTAYIGNRAVANHIIRNELIDNVIEHGKIEETASINAIGVRKDWPILRDILQKALDSISLAERRALLANWVPPDTSRSGRSLRLTKTEREWLDAHPVIKVAGSRSWPPVEFFDDEGRYQGLVSEYLEILSAMLDVRFDVGQPIDRSATVSSMKSGEFDMFPAAASSEQRVEFAIFTKPYLSLPAVIFTRDDVAYVDGIEGLANRKVAVVRGHALTEFLSDGPWNFENVEVADVPAALDKLQSGEVYAYVGSILVTSHFIRRQGHRNIVVAGQAPQRIEVAMASQRSVPIFASILGKALAAIPAEQRAAIEGKWIGVPVSAPRDFTLIWQSAIGGSLILLLFLGWNAFLQRKTAAQSGELRRQNAALQGEITERIEAERRAEAALAESRKSEQQLQQAQKMEAVGQLTGGIAHDFNNILTVILSNLDLMRDYIEENPTVRKLVDTAAQAGGRGADLTQRLLAYSRTQSLKPEATDVNVLVTQVIDLIGRPLGEKIEIEAVLADTLWPAMVDPVQLENAIVNLAINARDALPQGGTLTIETANKHFDGSSSVPHSGVTLGQYVVVTVSDTGTGMAPEVQARAFEPFFTTKDIGKGSGLGLSMVYGFTKQSAGHLDVQSALGAGTTIKLYLPKAAEHIATAPTVSKPHPGAQPTGDETILVVEDDPDVRESVLAALEFLGYSTIEAQDGRAALSRCAEVSHLDLLLTDVVLPGGLNGQQIAEEVRRQFPQIKTLFTSGYMEDEIFENIAADADVELLQKPYRRETLATTVRRLLDT